MSLLLIATVACQGSAGPSGTGKGLWRATSALAEAIDKVASEGTIGQPEGMFELLAAVDSLEEEWATVREEVERTSPEWISYVDSRVAFVGWVLRSTPCETCEPSPSQLEALETARARISPTYLRELHASARREDPEFDIFGERAANVAVFTRLLRGAFHDLWYISERL